MKGIKDILRIDDSQFSVGQLLRWLWQAFKGNRLQAVLNASLGLVGVAVSLSTVWAMKNAIDIASRAKPGSIYGAVAVMAVLILCEFAINIARVWIKNILGVKAQNRMQQQMLDRLLRSEWQARESHHSGDIINRLEQDVRNVVQFLTETLPGTVSVVAMFLGAFIYLMHMDVWLAIITVGILPLFLLLSRFYVRRMRTLTKRVRTSDSEIQSLLTETVQHRMLIKTMEAGPQMIDRLEDTQSELRGHVKRRTMFSVASNLVLNTGFSLGYLVAFLWGAVRLYQGTITFGAMSAFLQLVYRIQGPARDLTRLVPAFVSVFTAAERLMELEQAPEEQQGEARRLDAPCGLRLSDVCFAYDGEEPEVVSHLDFDFKPGSCTAVVGETGAGKTTLIRLMLALIKPNSGSLYIYNNVYAEEISPLHRNNFVYVPQGNTLLSGTIRYNLLLACPDATDDDLRDALTKACATFVYDLPQGIDTPCSEAGGGLSEGQAQRIAIARALLRNRSIMLFDEATSALDPDTERQLLHNILANHDKTIVFITHRLAVVDYCDNVLRVGQP